MCCGSKEGDQLCSNTAIVFGFIALALGIVTQSTCSFVTIIPGEIVNTTTGEDVANGTTSVSNNTIDVVDDGIQRHARSLNPVRGKLKERIIDFDGTLFDTNRTFTGNLTLDLTANIGPWRLGLHNDMLRCTPIRTGYLLDGPFRASRATGILSSIVGGLALAWACASCCRDEKSRRWINRRVSCVYLLAAAFSGLTMLMFHSDVCDRVTRNFERIELEVTYGGCRCRTGCVFNIVATVFWLVSAYTVLITA